MYEPDRECFGRFIAQLRKEKGYTQKTLAEKLSISDKAVSKWETGKSLPDVTLLIPLSQVLGITVTELLEAKRIEPGQAEAVPVEDMVKRTLAYSEESQEKHILHKRNHCLLCLGSILLSFFEMGLLLYLSRNSRFVQYGAGPSCFTLEVLNIIFSIYFWIFVKETLPSFYDENEINFYSDGIFRMNLPGLHFNNRNWPYIVRAFRLEILLSTLLCPLLYLLLYLVSFVLNNENILFIGQAGVVLLFLGLIFIPVYSIGKKYE